MLSDKSQQFDHTFFESQIYQEQNQIQKDIVRMGVPAPSPTFLKCPIP